MVARGRKGLWALGKQGLGLYSSVLLPKGPGGFNGKARVGRACLTQMDRRWTDTHVQGGWKHSLAFPPETLCDTHFVRNTETLESLF